VTPEITESMLEIATGIHATHAGLLTELQAARASLLTAADRLNVGICGGGTHPFQSWPDRRIFRKPRFQEVSALYGYLSKQFTVFGQHVHIGCPDGDDALYLLHALNRFVPHFIALAASSPFVQGRDTQFNSARLNSVFAFPLSGRAPFTMRWREFEAYFAKMERTGVVKSMKDFYWDIRPKPQYGTIELRVCDTPLTVERAAAIAGYLQALSAHLLDRIDPPPIEDDYLVYTYNRFQACRFGFDGTMVIPQWLQPISIREDILTTLRVIQPYAEALGGGAALDHIYAIAHQGSDASTLRRARNDSGSVTGVVEAALQRFRDGESVVG
jgi:carboxylate-amine ligase